MKVALVLGEVSWEAQFVSCLSHPSSKLKVVRRCVDGIDALSAINLHEIELVIVTESALRIEPEVVSQILETGTEIVAISNSDSRWPAIGISNVVSLDLARLHLLPQQIYEVLTPTLLAESSSPPLGKLVCVASFSGGVGRSFISRELAYQNAKRGNATVLVEADTYGPSVVQDLNLPVSTNDLLQITQMRIADQRLEEALKALAVVEPNLAVIPGISDWTLWPQLLKSNLQKLWSYLIGELDVVVDLGPNFPTLQSDLSNGGLLDRETSTATALAVAHAVTFCATTSPVSVARLINGLVESQELLNNVEISVVLNRSLDVSSSEAKKLSETVSRYTGVQNISLLEEDCHALRQCEVSQNFLAKELPKHRMNQTLQSVAQITFGDTQKASTKLQQVQLDRIKAA